VADAGVVRVGGDGVSELLDGGGRLMVEVFVARVLAEETVKVASVEEDGVVSVAYFSGGCFGVDGVA